MLQTNHLIHPELHHTMSNTNLDGLHTIKSHLNHSAVRTAKSVSKEYLAAVGFEPTPPKRLVPKTSALDRSATLPR